MMELNRIYSTQWKTSLNQAAQFRHFYAFKKGKCFISVATRTTELRFTQLPMMRGSSIEIDYIPNALKNDEVEARKKVVDWLKI